MRPQDIPVLPRGVRLHYDDVRESWFLLAPERALPLDPIGSAILTEVNGARSFKKITHILSGVYKAPLDQIADDCSGFLDALRERRFLEVST